MSGASRTAFRPWGGTLYLCGAGNSEGVRLALDVEARERRFRRIVLLDDDPATRDRVLLGVPVIGTFDLLSEADPGHDGLVNLVARTTRGRHRARERMAASGVPFAPLVAPDVNTLGATFDDDVIVYPHATLGPETVLDPGTVVFMGAVVGHESRVGAGCVLASNAVLNARVVLEDGVYIGTNATVLPEIRVGAGATVGAGSVATGDVPAGATVMGVPGEILVPGPGVRSEASTTALTTVPRGADSGPGPDTDRSRNAREWEARVSAAWSEVLGRGVLPPEDPVFDLGADSLGALRVVERLRRDGATALRVVDVFRHPTIRGLARRLAAGSGPTVEPSGTPAPAPSSPAAAVLPFPVPTAGGVAPDEEALLGAVVDAFGRALGRTDVGPDSHFFDLGGDTPAAQVVCEILQSGLGEPICFMQVVRRPTPAEFARHLAVSLGQPPECVAQGVLRRLVRRAVTHGG